MRLSTILTVVFASILPFSDLIFKSTDSKIVQYYQQGLSILIGSSKHIKNIIYPQSIIAMNLQIHACNAVLLLILADQFIKSQRSYRQQLRESACLIAVILFAVHPGRMEYLGKISESSVLQQFSICLSLIGVILSINFLCRKKWLPYSLVQAALSGAFLSGGAFLGAPVAAVAIPLLFYAAIVFQQIRCHLSFLNASILVVSHGTWAALAALFHSNCTESSAATWAPLCGSATPGSIILKALRKHNDAVLSTMTDISRYPMQYVAFLNELVGARAAGLYRQLGDILAQSVDSSSASSLSKITQLVEDLAALLVPAVAVLLCLWVVCHSVYDAVRWRPMTGFHFACGSLVATVLLSPPSLQATPLDAEMLLTGLYSCVPSALLSLCLAVSLADAWGAPILSKGTGTYTEFTGAPPVLKKGFLVSKAWQLLAVAVLCLGLQSYKEATRVIVTKEDAKVSFAEFSASFSRSIAGSDTTAT